MRSFRKWTVALFVSFVWVATTLPAEPAVAEGSTVKLLLLRQKSVQKELDVSPESAQRIMDFTHRQHEAFRKSKDAKEDVREKVIEQLRKGNETFLATILTPKQSKRLDQIAMQYTALHHLLMPQTIKELNLSDEQVQKFKDLQKEAHKRLVAIFETKEREGKSEKLAKLHEDNRRKILAILTDEQEAKVREKAGAPFKGKIEFEEPDDK